MHKTNNNFYRKLISIIILFIFLIPVFTFAQGTAPLKKLEEIQPDSGYEIADKYTISEVVGAVIFTFLSLLGVIFITLMLYGGFNWMTSAGDEQKLTRAKDTLRRAIIGIVITVGAYAIWNFVSVYFVFK